MDSQQPMKRSRADKGIGRMILLSLVLHVGAIAVMVMAGGQRQLEPVASKAYTVSLVDPIDLVDLAALGGGLAPGREKAVAQQPKIPLQPDKKASPPQVLPQAKEQVKEKPVETVEKTPPPPKAVKVKPEPKKEVVKLAEKSAKKPVKKLAKLAKKEKPKEEKKLKPKKVEKKDPPPIEKAKKEPEKKLAGRPSEDKSVKKPAPTPKKTLKKADPPISDTERDEQRLSTAIEQIRKQVESNSKQSGQAGAIQQARGNHTSGGSNGGVQGLAFMMYTEQVKQRVKESWIVTQKKSGLTAVVEFGVMPSGDIVDVELVQSSGSNAFDQSVLRAVHKANPLPPPPQEYQQEFLSQKVKVAFGK